MLGRLGAEQLEAAEQVARRLAQHEPAELHERAPDDPPAQRLALHVRAVGQARAR